MNTVSNCLVCGNVKSVDHYCAVSGYEYLKCGDCGLIFLDRIPDFSEISRAYDGGFWKSFRRKIVSPFRSFNAVKNFSFSVERAEKIMTFADSRRLTQNPKPKLLDIGCNKGFLLASAIERGYDVYGIEFVPELVVPFKRKYKEFAGNIYTGPFYKNYPSFSECMLDMVTAIDVIEHFESPREDVKKIYDILVDNGVFILRTPDSEAPQAKEFGDNWGALKPYEHLFLFNKVNLARFLEEIGFVEIEFFDPIEEGDGNFMAVARKKLNS